MALFRKGTPKSAPTISGTEPVEVAPALKYPKPSILLINLPDAVRKPLSGKGFNVSIGTLGQPYRVERTSSYLPLIGTGSLPNHTEQEIVVVDFAFAELTDGPSGEKQRPDTELDLFGKCNRGFLDPRVGTVLEVSDSFNRILQSGGVFVVFADEKTGVELCLGRIEYGNLDVEHHVKEDVWHILEELSDMTVAADYGTEMRPVDTNTPLQRLLARYLSGGRFTCTLRGGHRYEDVWTPLATNKFNEIVALARCRATNGTVIVLPQLRDKAAFIAELITNVLPELAPHLYPDMEQGKWIHWPEYELQRVIELKVAQERIVLRAKEELAKIDEDLALEREANAWIHRLIGGTDDDLVDAVESALSVLGFSNVKDVDAERDREGKTRREDLQVLDQSPTIVVDVKGIGGYPSDDDGLQAGKHMLIRMKEQGRTDIIGLSIINHQRHLPPLDRENEMPFRQELIDAAEEQTVGLLTAWDLYRLVRNFKKLGWGPEVVKPLFYTKGRIEPVPTHYQFIGTIAKVWKGKFGVNITSGELRVGDRVAIEFPIEFEEIHVASIYVDDSSRDKVTTGEPAGLLWPASNLKLRVGMRVFRLQEFA